MTVAVSPDNRKRLLRYASEIVPCEDREDAVKAATAALPLLEWAERAADEDDLELRMAALSQQYQNTCGKQYSSPSEFVESAETLYAFLGGGSRDGMA
jgi:hypothetical protein